MRLKMILLGLAAAALGLVACGQKGPLRLPDVPKQIVNVVGDRA